MSPVDLSYILTSSRALNAQLQTRPDLPTVNLGLDQVELQSRRLVNRYGSATSVDTGRGNFLLAQANVDAPSLVNSIAALNTTSTFSPLRALLDTDVPGHLRHAHEQTLISTIEEGRRETETEFYQVLEERIRKDWESRKKRIFEELGRHTFTDSNHLSTADLRNSIPASLSSSFSASSFHPSLQMHHKMMVYDRIISELTAARIGGTSYPIVHSLLQATTSLNSETTLPMQEILHVLSKIVKEPPIISQPSHGNAHLLNTPMYERKYARAYLDQQNSQEICIEIIRGAKEALEEQYWDIMEKTISSNPSQASLGGDPSASNRVRAYLAVKFYRNGQWEDHLEILNGKPLWAQLFHLLRAGHAEDAVDLANKHRSILDNRQRDFCSLFQRWALSGDGKIGDASRNVFRTHLEHSPTVDPFKAALFKLMGRVEPNKRNVPHVTGTTEDWMWFQLAMIDHTKESSGLQELNEVLLSYGERHFEGSPGPKGSLKYGVWAKVMLMCGGFERSVAALYDRYETQTEAVHLAIALSYYGLLRVTPRAEASDATILTVPYNRPPSLNFPLMIARYIRQFIRTDPKEAIQYVYCICLNVDQGKDLGREQLEVAWDLCRKVIVAAESSGGWEDLVGGIRRDGVKFNGELERALDLLKLDKAKYHNVILLPAARLSEKENRINEAIKLYNMADSPDTVLECLARALSNAIVDPHSIPTPLSELEQTAADILRHYEKTNKGLGKGKDTVVKLLHIRTAQEAWEKGYLDAALQAIEASRLLPMDGDLTTVTKFSEDFKNHDETIVRNLHIFLPLTMAILHKQHDNIKSAAHSEPERQTILASLRKKSRSLVMFAGMLRYRMPTEVYNRLLESDVDIAL